MKYFLLITLFFLHSNRSLTQKTFTVYFPTDKSYMVHSSKLELINFLTTENVGEIIKITGYTDTTASVKYNLELAQKRVEDIHFFLRKRGENISQNVITEAVGESFNQDAIFSKNRRVEIEFSSLPKVKKQIVEGNNNFTSLKKGDKIALKNLNFHGGQDVFLSTAYPSLKELLSFMSENENVHITIHGHICCSTLDLSNLSLRRAIKVFEFLVYNKINPERLRYTGHGSSRPIHPLPEKDEFERIDNRRVEIEITSGP